MNLNVEIPQRGKELLGRGLRELRRAGSAGHGLGTLGVARLGVRVGDWGSRERWAPASGQGLHSQSPWVQPPGGSGRGQTHLL